MGIHADDVPYHFPLFLWNFWLSQSLDPSLPDEPSKTRRSRIHIYDLFTNELSETQSPADCPGLHSRPVFRDITRICFAAGAIQAADKAEATFAALQTRVESILAGVVAFTQSRKLAPDVESETHITSFPMSAVDIASLTKYFVFLRFRNSIKYRELVDGLNADAVLMVNSASPAGALSLKARCRLTETFSPWFQQVRSQRILNEVARFLGAESTEDAQCPTEGNLKDPFQLLIDTYLWNLWEGAEVCLGVSEEQEFILPAGCFGILDERFGWGGEETEPSKECFDCFFPILPTVALYFFEGAPERPTTSVSYIDIGVEQPSDVWLRNAMILSAMPHTHTCYSIAAPSAFDASYANGTPRPGPKLYFSSLSSITKSISSYEEFRCTWFAEQFIDYSRLKQRCRQKFSVEALTRTLPIKGEVMVFDLTNEIEVIGDYPKAGGSFSDVWMGRWWDGAEGKNKLVAIKYLRPAMVQNVKEKLLKRLRSEVLTWHSLCNRNIAPLYGLVQSATSLGMVTQWCEGGTITSYLREKNPGANRLKLVRQIASAIQYLHSAKPTVVHGDLKGGNILVDRHGQAILTDFGLSKVIESVPELGMSSFIGGTMRWMAPELLLAALEDRIPHLTTFTDVYAFGSVCLEIVTDQLPYPSRSNDAAVSFDIMHGVPPSRGASLNYERMPLLRPLGSAKEGHDLFTEMMEMCWTPAPECRPSMDYILRFLVGLESGS